LIFNSYEYALFLPVVLLLYWRLPHRAQNAMLLVASYIFYGAWNYRFLGLMALSTGTDYTVGRLLGATDDPRRRKRIFLISLAVNLGVLGFFKYFNFFVDSGAAFIRGLGLQAHPPTLRILLPIGISFYTFHGISYTFDVFRREIEPARNLLDFALFVSFFPQLVAGPIGRAQVQLPQFQRPRPAPSAERFRSGIFLILLGLFKKIVIADSVAPFVNAAFGGARTAGAAPLLIGVYAFALQIYGDFSGYSDIARGSSRLFGIELLRNFDQPYLSRNITAFWRTWHISLSTWLRDYLYVPLGGNRGSKFATYRNLMLTMLFGGLWHGTKWTFVMWGGLHGAYLCVHRLMGTRSRASAPPATVVDDGEDVRAPHTAPPPTFSARRDLLPALATFHIVCFAWIFFRADSFRQAFDVLTGIVTLRGGSPGLDAVARVGLAAVAILLIDLYQRNKGSETAPLAWSPIRRGALYFSFGFLIILFSGGTSVPFIYFQF
jgi:alginate O-acetyltransferase complex protein AlgI